MALRSVLVVLVSILGSARGQAGGGCVPQGFPDGLDGVTLDFLSATIAVNNMGGYGPEQQLVTQPYIRYNGIGYDYVDELSFDLIVQNTSYYKPNKVIRNGYTFAGDFGSLNLADDESCDFAYMFRESGTEDAFYVGRGFEFCLFDFDSGDKDGDGVFRLIEVLEVCQADVTYQTSTEKTGGLIESSVEVTQTDTDCYRFEATQRGYGSDNPERPDQVLRPYASMTPFIKEFVAPKYVCLGFPPNLNQFEVTYSITPSAEPGFSGRNFLFSGNTANTLSVFYIPCYHCPDPTYGEPVTGSCIPCGGQTGSVGGQPCMTTRENSWNNQVITLFNPDCPKEIATYCDPLNPDPEGVVVYPDCLVAPYNCASTCNAQADTCFPPPPPPPPPAEWVCYEYNCVSCDSQDPAVGIYCTSENPITYPNEASCESNANDGIGCDPIVCMEGSRTCEKCSSLPKGGTGNVFDLSPTANSCPETETLGNPVPGYKTSTLCATATDTPCGERAYTCWDHVCYDCDEAACQASAECQALCQTNPFDNMNSCQNIGIGGDGCDPVVCIVETEECKSCSELDETTSCTIYGVSEMPEACQCPDTCPPKPGEDPSHCTHKNSNTCYAETPCGSVPPPPPPKCAPECAECGPECYACGGAGEPECASYCEMCGPECQGCGESAAPAPGCGEDDDDDDCDDDDDDKSTSSAAYAAEVAAKAAEVAEAAAQQAVVMAQAAMAADAEVAKLAAVAARKLALASEAKAAAEVAAAEAKSANNAAGTARAEAQMRAAAEAQKAAQAAAQAEAQASAHARKVAEEAAAAQAAFTTAERKATTAAAAAAAAAGIDAPQLTLSATKTTASIASAPAAASSTRMLLVVVFVAGILGLAIVHAVLRSNRATKHDQVPSAEQPAQP